MAQSTITIKNSSLLTAKGREFLTAILKNAGLTKAWVTSGMRTPANQARIMYNNIKATGAAAQKKLYGISGDQVIDVYEANKDKPEKTVIKVMEAKIKELGPAKVSAHCRTTGDVFDVAPSSIVDRPAFEKAVKAHSDVKQFLMPPTDPSYHIVLK